MKPIPITSILLGLLVFPIIHAQPEAVPPAFEQKVESDSESSVPDPFDPDRTAPRLIQIQVEYIELAHEALTKLLFLAEPKTTDATALRKQLQEMVAKEEAKVLETQLLISRSGQRSTTESNSEFTYPTEFQAPSLPGSFSGSAPPEHSSVASGEHALPTAFDTRNLGSTLEIEPTLSWDENFIDLRLNPELVWHTGNTVWQEIKDSTGNVSKIQMPEFYRINISTSLVCVSGKPTMVGILSPKDSKGAADFARKVIVFVKCDVLTVK